MRMRSSWIMSVAVLALSPGLSQAQVTLGPTLAFSEDADLGIGAMVKASLPGLGERVGLMADFILFFPSPTGVDYLEINGNVMYGFPVESSKATPFVLAGLNLARGSFDASGVTGSNTDLGLNLGGGVEIDAGSFRPVLGVRIEVRGGESFVVFGTLPFVLGN